MLAVLLYKPLSGRQHDLRQASTVSAARAHGEAHRLAQHVVDLHRQPWASNTAGLAAGRAGAPASDLRVCRLRHAGSLIGVDAGPTPLTAGPANASNAPMRSLAQDQGRASGKVELSRLKA